jgi:hypothetical protein
VKHVIGLSSIVLISFLNSVPGLALNNLSRNISRPDVDPTLSNPSKPVILADLFRTIDRVLDTVDHERQRQEARDAAARAERDRQEREAERDRQAQEAARQQQQTQQRTTPQSQPNGNPQVNFSNSTIIYKDENPQSCQFQNRGLERTCKSFQLLQNGELYYFRYVFENSPSVMFTTPTTPLNVEENVGDVGTEAKHYAIVQILGTESRDSETADSETVCSTFTVASGSSSSQFNGAICSGAHFQALYTRRDVHP